MSCFDWLALALKYLLSLFEVEFSDVLFTEALPLSKLTILTSTAFAALPESSA